MSFKPVTVAPQELIQLATFHVGSEEYALDIMRIKEIINPLKITPVPRAPGFIEGVVELRGAILPVVDLRKRFDVEVRGLARSTKYIIVGIEGRIIGLIVDAVGEVLRLARAEVRPTPTLVEGDSAHFFTGVCHHAGRIIMILDIDRVLSSTEKISLIGLGGPGPRSNA
jgi:purine-binding chemotaxis protein CheW